MISHPGVGFLFLGFMSTVGLIDSIRRLRASSRYEKSFDARLRVLQKGNRDRPVR